MQVQTSKVIDLAFSKLKKQDIQHRGFLKPIQIHLKTHRTEQGNTQSKLKTGGLPGGLKIAFKESIMNNKFDLHAVQEIKSRPSYSEMKTNFQDNILTLMKSKEGIELAICVCMYSEDKKMLKSTLAGIKENISNIVAHQNISSDKIGVFVMMDGIEKVDPSVVDYFQELERQHNINLGDNIAPTLSLEEMAQRSKSKTQQEINQEELKNVNNFLFDPAELEERNLRRFSTVRDEYDNVRKLLKNIKKLKNQKPLLDDLPSKIRPFFVLEARQQYMKQYNLSVQEIKQFSQEKIIEEYANDLRKMKPIIIKALTAAQKHCEQFISTREDLAYLASYRVKVRHGIDKLPPNTRESKYADDEQELGQELAEDNQYFTFMNLFLCVKYKNSGKLSSHNWFFNGFCKELRPRYAVLLDVGLRPQAQALHRMYKYMKQNKTVGGVCGYMSLKIERLEEDQELKDDQIDFLTNIAMKFTDIQRTQQVEYHFAHLMDKPFQASFGFIHVLPGAFSAYNMDAILDYDKDDDELLKSYFKSIDEKLKNGNVTPSRLSIGSVLMRTILPDFINSCFIDIKDDSQEQMLYNQNIYLAEDRILCMGIHKKKYDMAFLPDAYAEVDPIKTVHGLLGQRKRWINGSFFAFEKVKKQLREHEKTNGVECMLHLQMFYLTLMNSLSYFAPAFFLFTVHIAMEAFRADVLPKVLEGVVSNPNSSQFYNGFVYTIDFIYVILICSIVFFSLHLTNGNKKYKPYLYAISTIFGIFSLIVFVVLLVDVIRGIVDNAAFLITNQAMAGSIPGGVETINILRWILVGSTAIYILPIITYLILFKQGHVFWEILLGSVSFLFYGPTYLNILNIYALCRIDDISWGTKGLDSGSSNQNSGLKDSWKLLKFVHVGKYVFWNIIVGVVILSFGSSYTPRFFITIVMVALMASSLGIKIFVGCLYMIKYKLSTFGCCQQNRPPSIQQRSRIVEIMTSCEEEIMLEIKKNLEDMSKDYVAAGTKFKKNGGSFIQASRTKNNVQKSFKKSRKEHLSKSKILRKEPKISLANSINAPLQPIQQQDERRKKPKIKRIDSNENIQSPAKHEKSFDALLGKNEGSEKASIGSAEAIQNIKESPPQLMQTKKPKPEKTFQKKK